MLITNVDICVPFLKLLKISWIAVFFITWPIAIAELCMWWLFWQWFEKIAYPEIRDAAKSRVTSNGAAQEGIDLWHDIKNHLEELWFMFKELVISHFLKVYTTATDKENITITRIKKWGHIFVLLLGVAPIPTTRTITAIICSVTKWRSGFAILLIGDILHVAGIILGWKMLFHVASKIN